MTQTKTKRFDSKVFRGKQRIYVQIPGSYRISRLYLWNETSNQYEAPVQGKAYMARRYEPDFSTGKPIRKERFFESLEEARHWQSGVETKSQVDAPANDGGPLFKTIVEEWRSRCFGHFALGTQVAYDKLIRLYFGPLTNLGVRQITSRQIDLWIDELKKQSTRSIKRRNFVHELQLLSTILRYYAEYHDEDREFQFPIKKRHRKTADLGRGMKTPPKDLTATEFARFRDELARSRHGRLYAVLATVQYFQALRISEAAALHWEDVVFHPLQPSKSRLKVCRAVIWPRKKGLNSFVRTGFKNADSNEGLKEQPLFREAFEALRLLYQPGAQGLIFSIEAQHLDYRSIQFQYDQAFKRAGLPYRGTHIMRHGGCRNLYNEVPDLAVAQQLLGNSSIQTTLVYAKRQASALTKVAEAKWERSGEETGCKWLQPANTEQNLLLLKGDK